MRWLQIALVAGLAALTLTGCRLSQSHGASAKGRFVSAADRICATHLQRVMDWLVQPRTGDESQQASETNAGIYEIISTTVTRLETLGRAPGPDGGAFSGYVGTLKARASLYMLIRIAYDRREPVSALRFQRRINEIDTLGDRKAHRYGLRICGTGGADVAKAFSAAGWR